MLDGARGATKLLFMNLARALFIAVFAAVAIQRPACAAGDAEELKQRVLAQARTSTPEEYAFTRTAKSDQTDDKSTKQRVLVEHYDPAKPADQRWTLVSVDGRTPTADELTAHRKDVGKRRAAYYGRIANYFGSPATTSTDARGRTIFRFTSLPKDSVVVNDADISANCTCEATVNTSGATPFVEQTRFTLTKPVRLKLVAKIEKFESTNTYRLQGDGKPVPVEQVSDMNGSMMGKSGRIRTTISYTDHRPAGRR